MGNCGSRQWQRRHHRRQQSTNAPAAEPELTGNRYTVPAANTNYQIRNSNSHPPSQYFPGYYPMPQLVDPNAYYQSNNPLPYPGGANLTNGQYGHQSVVPYVEHQKALTIHNDVNVKKESLMMEPDEENPGKSLVSFKFDATAAGR